MEPSATASTGKNISGLILLDQSCSIMQILLVIDDIAWKKLRYTLKGSSIDFLLVDLKLMREEKTKRIEEKMAPLAAKFFWPRVNYSTR